MPNLTLEQSQNLWDKSTKKVREFVNGVYYTTRVHSNLDGFNYYIDSLRQSLAITETSTTAEIETITIAQLQLMEYLGSDPIGKSVPFN